jgi:hypothetical protein
MLIGCSKEKETGQAAADSVRVADSVRLADSVRTADSVKAAQAARDSAAAVAAKSPAKPPAREQIVKVKESTPGLLSQAKILPIDAQHLALTKYPDGAVRGATITRRGRDLVYVYDVRPKGSATVDQVVVNAMDGSLINTLRKDVPVKKP